jgi:RnfABCDGE-type electron transport complex G subunit
MPKQLHFALVLFIITAVCVGGINAIYSASKSNIEKECENAKMRGVRVAFGFAENDASVKLEKMKFKDSAGKEHELFIHEKGYAVEGAKDGYSGKVKVIVAVSPGIDKLVGISVIQQTETPGFGAEVVSVPARETWWTKVFGGGPEGEPTIGEMRPLYQRKYFGLKAVVLEKFKAVKDAHKDGKVDAISGATITSQALFDAVKAAVKILKELKQADKLPSIKK